jgi:hypothetical protein
MTTPRPRDDRDAALDLAEIAAHIGHLKGDDYAYLIDLNYSTFRLRLENAHAAVEAAMVEARTAGTVQREPLARGSAGIGRAGL